MPQPNFRLVDVGFTLADIFKELGRSQDRVDERADEREKGGGSRAADQKRICDATSGVGKGEHDQGDPDREQHQHDHRCGQVQGGVFDSEDGDRHGELEEHPSE
ncbi:MAG TPA: hypothetical protein PKD76_00570 [Solirubrobacterales bacterium]|nr:hypothetical protein [Solirubrobacterales bacterium]